MRWRSEWKGDATRLKKALGADDFFLERKGDAPAKFFFQNSGDSIHRNKVIGTRWRIGFAKKLMLMESACRNRTSASDASVTQRSRQILVAFQMTRCFEMTAPNPPGKPYYNALLSSDLKQFRSLWSRLPALAKERTTISALVVKTSGEVEEVR
jgi:hypothetical protein